MLFFSFPFFLFLRSFFICCSENKQQPPTGLFSSLLDPRLASPRHLEMPTAAATNAVAACAHHIPFHSNPFRHHITSPIKRTSQSLNLYLLLLLLLSARLKQQQQLCYVFMYSTITLHRRRRLRFISSDAK